MKLQSILFVACAAILSACQSTSGASNDVAASPKDALVDVEGAFKVAPASMLDKSAVAANPSDAKAPVASAPKATSECGLTVLEKSPAAVGLPCLTSIAFMKQLGLNDQQIARVEKNAQIAKVSKKSSKAKKTAH